MHRGLNIRVHFLHNGARLSMSALPGSKYFGLALRSMGERDEALRHLRTALSLRPDWPVPMNEIAWILATHPDTRIRNPGEAVRLAERAVERTARRQPVMLDTLAAAYAAIGDFDRAAAVAQEAMSLAASGGPVGLSGEIAARLELYRQKKPFRETDRRSAGGRP